MALLVSSVFGDSSLLNAWMEAGHHLIALPPLDDPPQRYSEDLLAERCHDAHILMCDGIHRLTASLMDRLPNLQAIVIPFIGTNLVDVEAASTRSILVVNSPTEEHFVETAEATILLMLALNKRLHHMEDIVREGRRGGYADFNDMLSGRTIGIIGLGNIGRRVAQRLRGWQVRILANSRHLPAIPPDLEDCVELVDLPTLLSESDFVSIHTVLTKETYHLIGGHELQRMKPTAYLINTARGAIVDEDALADAIELGIIRGAALDVFETEPLPVESRLLQLDPTRVILTPHSIGHAYEGIAANGRRAVASALELAAGHVPASVVNPDAAPAWQKRMARFSSTGHE
jgi:phosphoglycerate dehydrogenase-like enzyme